MGQLFDRRANLFARIGVILLVVIPCAGGWIWNDLYWSPWITREMTPLEQPVPFSHKHHVYGLGLDCRFCHTTVEKSAFAGVPSTETCMTCHSQIWKDANLLAPVRESLAQEKRLQWSRVNATPDFVFFDHSIHVSKGIGCVTCHGEMDKMPLTWESHALYMKWCLDCHRAPEKYIRPRDQVFNLHWQATNQMELGKKLVVEHQVQTRQLEDCSMCHR